jgi:hypothetical protein
MVAGVMLSGRLFEMLGTEPLAMTRALRTSTVDREELEYHEQTAARFMVDYEQSGPVALLVPALEHFHAVRRLVEQRQPASYQRRLCRVGAQLASLLGIFAYETEARARSWFHASQRAAQEAGDGELWAWALANESLIPGYGGNPQEALDLLRKARRVLGRRPTVVAAMVMARTARAERPLACVRLRGRDGPGRADLGSDICRGAGAVQLRRPAAGLLPHELPPAARPAW